MRVYFAISSIICLISLPNFSAFSIVEASEYMRIIGSVLLLRKCTQLSAKSIFTPSMSVTFSSAYFSFIAASIASTSISGVSSILFLAMLYCG